MIRGRLFGATAMAGLLAVSLTGCGGNVPGPLGALADRNTPADQVADAMSDAADEINDGGAASSEEDLSDQITIDAEYSCLQTDSDEDINHVIVFTNHSAKTVEVESNSEVLDGDGEMVGVGMGAVCGIGPGSTCAISEEIDNAEDAQSFKTTLSASEDTVYDSVDELQTDVSTKGDKTFLRVSNSGKSMAEEVDFDLLYFKDGKLVSAEDDCVTNLKPGKSLSCQHEYYGDEDFDSVKVYTNGYLS